MTETKQVTTRWERRTARPIARKTAKALVVIAAAACRSTADVTLGEEDVVSTSTEVGAAPMFALSPSGGRTVAWVSAPGGGTDGRLYVATDGAAPAELRDSTGGIEPHGEAPPKIVYAPDGTLHALYAVGRTVEGRRFPFTTLRLASSHDGGRSWSAPRTVGGDSVPGSRNFHALHAAADGSLYVTWLEARGGMKSATYITRSTDAGVTWETAVRVATSESCPCCRTAIATADDGTLYLAWRAVLPGNVRDIVVASSRDAGKSWSQPVRAHADDWVFDGCPHAGPSLAVDSRRVVHIAWWTGKDSAAGVWYARSEDGARTFGDAIPLGVAAFSRPAHVQLALDGDSSVVAAWDDAREALPAVTLRVSRDGGRTFGEPVIASVAGVAATFPVLALRHGKITVAWAQRSRESMAHAEHARPDMKDPKATMPLPSVGAQEIRVRSGAITGG